MLRQMFQALRFACADFFDVPWQAVVSMLAVIVLLVGYAYFRTVGGNFGWRGALLTGALIAVYAGGRWLREQ